MKTCSPGILFQQITSGFRLQKCMCPTNLSWWRRVYLTRKVGRTTIARYIDANGWVDECLEWPSVARTKVTRGEACSMFNNQTDELITSHVTHPHLIISESLQSKGQWVLISSLYNKKYLLIIHLISIYYWIWQQFQDPRSICLNDALKEFSIFSLKRFFQLFVVNSIRKIILLYFLQLITNYLSELKT